MLGHLFSNSILSTDYASISRGLLLQRLLIVCASFMAIGYEKLLSNSVYLETPSFTAIACLGLLYLGLTFLDVLRKGSNTEFNLFVLLILDATLLLLLVSFSGGTANPFIYYLLVMVAINAAFLHPRPVWIFTILSILAYSGLFYLDIKTRHSHSNSGFELHLFGMWINFVGSALLISFFVSGLSFALRERQKQLSIAREQNLRNEQLVGIGTLAASTVHALRTPLSTMAVLLSDLKSEHEHDKLSADFELLLTQVDRCKETTDRLASLAESPQGENASQSPENFLEALKEHYQITHPEKKLVFENDLGAKNCFIASHILLTQALLNLIDNAIQAASKEVRVCFETDTRNLLIKIYDDGAGIPEEVRDNWGKPFLSKKQSGLGIGSFLANSTIERFGGEVTIESPEKKFPDFKTLVSVKLPFANNHD